MFGHVSAGVGHAACVYVRTCACVLCAEGRISTQGVVIGTISVVLRQNQKSKLAALLLQPGPGLSISWTHTHTSICLVLVPKDI